MGADFLNKFNKTIYYIEGLDLMVGEVDDINKYNLMMSIGNVYDDLEDAIKAIITKIDNYIKVNEKMINEFKSAIKDQEYIKFDLTSNVRFSYFEDAHIITAGRLPKAYQKSKNITLLTN